jgi:hypothetical protein
MKRPVWYLPPERGFERELKKRVEYFAKLRAAGRVTPPPPAGDGKRHAARPSPKSLLQRRRHRNRCTFSAS